VRRRSISVLLCLVPLLAAETCTPPPPPQPRIVATFGDSLTAGVGSAPGYAEKLPATWTVANEAVAGQCGSGCVYAPGSAADIQTDLAALVQDPGVETLVAMWGTNDAILYGFIAGSPGGLELWQATVLQSYVTKLVASVNYALGLGVQVVVAFPPPVFVDGAPDDVVSPRIRDIRAAVGAALEGLDVATVDLYALLEDDPQLFGEDGIHFTENGAQIVADAIRVRIQQLP
jgi:lysophospholipase L1-like esterase